MVLLSDDVVQIVKDSIRDIPDFPKPGIVFKDITTLLNDQAAFKRAIDIFEEKYQGQDIDYIAGLESRGFIFGPILADRLGLPFVPIRKPGKLPGETFSQEYQLEYGTDCLEVHQDAFNKPALGKKVLIVDDLLATGGTVSASIDLIKKAGGEPIGAAFVIELDFLHGKDKITDDIEVFSLVHY